MHEGPVTEILLGKPPIKLSQFLPPHHRPSLP